MRSVFDLEVEEGSCGELEDDACGSAMGKGYGGFF